MSSQQSAHRSQSNDVENFIATLRAFEGNARLKELWHPGSPTFLTRAPGRLDVMGGIADYSGSLVLQLPLAEATLVALQLDESNHVTLVSLSENRSNESAVFTMPLDEFLANGEPVGYAVANPRSTRSTSTFVCGPSVDYCKMRRRQTLQY